VTFDPPLSKTIKDCFVEALPEVFSSLCIWHAHFYPCLEVYFAIHSQDAFAANRLSTDIVHHNCERSQSVYHQFKMESIDAKVPQIDGLRIGLEQ